MSTALEQSPLFQNESIGMTGGVPPTTRYQGSKLKLVSWIQDLMNPLEFDSALDAFSGTSTVGYMMKAQGKRVVTNDYLRCNQIIGKALVENNGITLEESVALGLLERVPGVDYDTVVEDNYHDIYFPDDENQWIDVVSQNIAHMSDPFEQAIAYYALFQSCIAKRPYNLFHRKNLYMRTAVVERSFGNKATWDKPFTEHFIANLREVNNAVFDNGCDCRSMCGDALNATTDVDLVYIDTPYTNGSGTAVNYADFYNFLEGIASYGTWRENIVDRKKHRPFNGPTSRWSIREHPHKAFAELFERYRDSTIVVSYRSDGIPTEDELVQLLRQVKSNVDVHHFGEYQYVLSKNSKSREILLIGS